MFFPYLEEEVIPLEKLNFRKTRVLRDPLCTPMVHLSVSSFLSSSEALILMARESSQSPCNSGHTMLGDLKMFESSSHDTLLLLGLVVYSQISRLTSKFYHQFASHPQRNRSCLPTSLTLSLPRHTHIGDRLSTDAYCNKDSHNISCNSFCNSRQCCSPSFVMVS